MTMVLGTIDYLKDLRARIDAALTTLEELAAGAAALVTAEPIVVAAPPPAPAQQATQRPPAAADAHPSAAVVARVQAALANRPAMTMRELLEAAKVSKSTLQGCVRAGVVTASGSTAARRYSLPAPAWDPLEAGSTAHRVAQMLQRGPHTPREIRDAADLTSAQFDHAIAELKRRKMVTPSGSHMTRRYALAPEYQVVWSGAAERAGSAPSLLGDRPQRGAS